MRYILLLILSNYTASATTTNHVSFENPTCEICFEACSKDKTVLCENPNCKKNICNDCYLHYLQTAKKNEDILGAPKSGFEQQGNNFIIECPFCTVTSLRDNSSIPGWYDEDSSKEEEEEEEPQQHPEPMTQRPLKKFFCCFCRQRSQ
jgi:hypothetical protein